MTAIITEQNKSNSLFNNLQYLENLVYKKCGFEVTDLKINLEGIEYSSCSFKLNNKFIQYRKSKITPKKIGQFVALWKRSESGITLPFDNLDKLDFIIITAKCNGHLGQFIFPKSVLIKQGILSQNDKGGKRGIRVYPPWELTSNKQAMKTQQWQTECFIEITNEDFNFIAHAKNLLSRS